MSSDALQACTFNDSEALPQRQPRAKRQRASAAEPSAAPPAEPAAAQPAAAAGTAPAAAPAEAPAGDGAAAEQGPEAGGNDGAADATPASNQLQLQEYRSAAVPGFNFECEPGAAGAARLH